MNVPSDYLLVKDKDGVMKYFKDGAFFSIEEIEQKFKLNGQTKKEITQKEVVLTPTEPSEKQKSHSFSEEPRTVVPALPKIEKGNLEQIKQALLAGLKNDDDEIKKDVELSEKRTFDQNAIDDTVARVVQKLKIQFSDPETAKRFNNLLATYFRNIRTDKELSYVLSLPKLSGGMDVPKDKVALILTVVDEARDSLHRTRRQVVVAKSEQSKQLAPPPPATVISEPYTKYLPQKEVSNQPFVASNLPKNNGVQKPLVAINENRQPKSSMETIKSLHGNKLIGPIEELGLLDIKNFRQLGITGQQIFDKMLNKFEILQSQGLLKKIAGRNAWKKSSVYQIYLAMTMQAMFEKKSIAEVIKNRQIKNLPVIMLSEYEVIGKINIAIND
ncbi:MAG: hypothetical protein WCT18_03310 [Patescibacteria group bacterium]